MSAPQDNLFDDLLDNMKTKKKEEEKQQKAPSGATPKNKEPEKPITQVQPEKKDQTSNNTIDIGLEAPATPQKPQEQPKQKVSIETLKPTSFVVEEDHSVGKEIVTIFGHKGHGKTTTAMSFIFNETGSESEIVVLSFDRKAKPIKDNLYAGNPKIHVVDCIKYMDYTDQLKIVKSADVTFDYILAAIEWAKQFNPDWIIIDGSEVMQQICEWKMRAQNEIQAFEGFKNFNLWKERRALVRQIHNKIFEVVNKGIIYTCYVNKDEIVEKGEVVASKDVPKWIDVILMETDYVFRVDHDYLTSQFVVEVTSSKNDKKFKTGQRFIVTGKRFYQEAMKASKPNVEVTGL